MLEFQLFGPFGIFDPEGLDRRPKLKKSRAILAVLAATKGHRHSRSWFQNLLWEDRRHPQSLSSLRSALTDIRRHLGPYSDAMIADHSEIALDPAKVRVNLEYDQANPGTLLEGFDIAHAQNFEDWLREARSHFENLRPAVLPRAPDPQQRAAEPGVAPSFLLASRRDAPDTLTRMQCDVLVDCIAKSLDDLGIAETVDGRGRGESLEDYLTLARDAGCSHILVSETAEGASSSIARIKSLEVSSATLIWSKSVVGDETLDLEDPATISVVAEFIDVIADHFMRRLDFDVERLPPSLMAALGVNHIFKLGAQNFETADAMLRQAHRSHPRGRYLAWRAYLRTIMLGELEFLNREAVIDEGTSLARRALEDEPHNSMVLALCAQVENMLHNAYRNAFDLASQALELNRCNPLAWTSLGAAAAFLDCPREGQKYAEVGARLSAGARMSFKMESWSSATGILSGDLKSARMHAELAHAKAPLFAPPLRYLSALYCAEGQFDLAQAAAEKLRIREPDFTLDRLRDEGYPSDCLRQARLLETLPTREV